MLLRKMTIKEVLEKRKKDIDIFQQGEEAERIRIINLIDKIVSEQIEDAKWKGNDPETDYIPVDKLKEMIEK